MTRNIPPKKVTESNETIPTSRLESAALYAAGALDGAELREFESWLQSAGAPAAEVVSQFEDVVSLTAATISQDGGERPSPDVRARILDVIAKTPQEGGEAGIDDLASEAAGEEAAAAFSFLMANEGEWKASPFKGVRYRELSAGGMNSFAVVLGDLAPGAEIPGHYHRRAEEVYVLSGDLCTNGVVLGAGDYMRAAAGTFHQTAISKTGCRAIVIMGRENYPRRSLQVFDKVARGFKSLFGGAS